MTDNDAALRPRSWNDYIGQAQIKERLDVHIRAAVMNDRALTHVLLAGPPGVGKTTIARIIAARLDDPLVILSKPIPARQFTRAVSDLGAGVLFIDEIHRLPRSQQEDLLPLLEDGYIDTSSGRLECPWVTVIGATTEREKVIKPLLDRFMVKPIWDPYTDDEMAQIVSGFAVRAGLAMDDVDAKVLGRAAGGVPRHAREMIIAYRDLWESSGVRPMAGEVVAFCDCEFDGLNRSQIDYLDHLERLGGQAGVETLASRMQLHTSECKDLERLLLDRELLVLGAGGRFLTTAGRARIKQDTERPRRRRPA